MLYCKITCSESRIVTCLICKLASDLKNTVTSPKQLLYVTRDATRDHMIHRPFRTLIHENLRRNFQIFTEKNGIKDCIELKRL